MDYKIYNYFHKDLGSYNLIRKHIKTWKLVMFIVILSLNTLSAIILSDKYMQFENKLMLYFIVVIIFVFFYLDK